MTRYRETERQEILAQTRRRLLDAAVSEIARHGYEGANVERIAAAAGLAKGTLYNHFPSKRELMMSLIDEIGEQHVDYVATRILAENEPPARVRAFFRAGFAFVEEHLERARLALTTLNSPDDAFNARLFQAYYPLFTLLAREILQPGMTAGTFRPGNLEMIASLLMTLYLGSAASIAPTGKPYMQPDVVADFALAALCLQPDA
jgi:AcrR family transcriptional regulator